MRKHLRLIFISIFLVTLLYASINLVAETPKANTTPVQKTTKPLSRQPTPTTHRQKTRDLRIKSKKCPGTLLYDNYCVLSNVLQAEEIVNKTYSVTLCTQGTPEFLHHVRELCPRWGGPLSVAVYAPGYTYLAARIYMEALRVCDTCVKKWVTWHIFFDINQIPSLQPFNFLGKEAILFDASCTRDYLQSAKLKLFREQYQLTYPINVARNIARFMAQTKFVFSSDIELYPSKNIIPRFLEMIRQSAGNASLASRRQVWVLPVFEIKFGVTVPTEKQKLYSLYKQFRAISFHKYRCNVCHRIPNLDQWLRTSGDSRRLRVFSTVKRQKAFGLQEWEPFFIGTNEEPAFDPRLNWEGKQNKMQVAYEMCQLDYDFNILDDAFLVHAPGISGWKRNSTKEKKRSKYVKMNNRIMKTIKQTLKVKYNHTEC